MKKQQFLTLRLTILVSFLFLPATLYAANLTVLIKNVRNSQGKIILAVYNESESFWKRKDALKVVKNIPIGNNQAKLTIKLDKGLYAIGLFHDEDDNGEFEFNRYKQPLEGWGISRNSRGYPTFEEAAVEVGSGQSEIMIKMLYASKVPFLIEGVRNKKGKLMMGIYNRQKTFLKPDGAVAGSRNIEISGSSAAFDFMLLPGNYAASVVHDENSNDELDTNFIGIPKEGYGFSRNAAGSMGPPKFRDAAFFVSPEGTKIQKIKLKY